MASKSQFKLRESGHVIAPAVECRVVLKMNDYVRLGGKPFIVRKVQADQSGLGPGGRMPKELFDLVTVSACYQTKQSAKFTFP